MRRALQIILFISLAGMTFSGALVYRELFAAAPGQCNALGSPGSILGYPPCVYGLVMYAALFVTAVLGLRAGSGKEKSPRAPEFITAGPPGPARHAGRVL